MKAEIAARLRGTSIQLTQREREVFELRTQRIPIKQIADRLGIAPKTVDTHANNANRKLKIVSAEEIVRRAIAKE